MIRIHQLAKTYHKLPTEILFPKVTLSPQVELAINNIVFETGYEYEMELELEEKKFQIELDNKRFEAMFASR